MQARQGGAPTGASGTGARPVRTATLGDILMGTRDYGMHATNIAKPIHCKPVSLCYDFSDCYLASRPRREHSFLKIPGIKTEAFSLASGIFLYVCETRLQYPVSITCTNIKGSVGFGFCMAGNMFVRDFKQYKNIQINSGELALFSSPDYDSYTDTVEQQRTIRLSVSILKNCIDALEETYRGIGNFCKFLLCKDIFIHTDKITVEMHAIVAQILNCDFSGAMRRMYLDAKVMELFICCLNKYGVENRDDAARGGISVRDMECARNAAYMLTHDLDNVPTLHALSKTIGMSRSKLHQVFQKVYGMPPFEYLRRYRLEKAKEMLQRSQGNVTEAAFAAGYSSLSHFTKAFNRRYNCRPSECLRH